MSEKRPEDKSYYPEWLKRDLSRFFGRSPSPDTKNGDNIADDLVKDKATERLNKMPRRGIDLDR